MDDSDNIVVMMMMMTMAMIMQIKFERSLLLSLAIFPILYLLDFLHSIQTCKTVVEELETNLMSLVMFITLNICSTCFEH